MEKLWLKSYPKGVRHEIPMDEYDSVAEIFEDSVKKFRNLKAFTNMGKSITYNDLDRHTRNLAAYLQKELKLKPGAKVAIQMPNVLQFPIAAFGAIRAGMIVTNINPLYTERELEHQLRDSDAEVIIVVDNFASKLDKIIHNTKIKHVITTQIGDFLSFPKSMVVNFVLKHVKKMVPDYHLPQSVTLTSCLARGSQLQWDAPSNQPQDTIFVQYTGGTTGVSKGAELSHRNIISNMLMIKEWLKPLLKEGEEIVVSPLPMYHIFSLTVNCLTMMSFGSEMLLITNPRDIPGMVKDLKTKKFSVFVGLNTLFNALMNNEDFRNLDFSSLKISVGGGMAMQKVVTEKWLKLTGTPIVEGYGLTESSPLISVNPIDGTDRVGTIGLPAPNTLVKLVTDDSGTEAALGEPGEIWAKGPQIMKGYWKNPEETKKTITSDGWLKTGDIGTMDKDGFVKIVDRKKDMILVSGFNVYPNELEDTFAAHPKILEVAAIGVPDANSGEVPKLFIVKRDESLTEEEVRKFGAENLTGYKRPKHIQFMTELPKSPVGKILRKDLRGK